MKRIISVLILLIMTTIPVVASANPSTVTFSDVAPSNSHYAGVTWVAERGIDGYPDGTYKPNNPLSRQHAAIFFATVLDLPLLDAGEVTRFFDDVTPDHPYAKEIATVGWAGIFSGSNGNFNPEETLTRQQMATILVAAFDLSSYGEDVPIYLGNVGESHQKNVQIIANLNITNQIEDFRPMEKVTRGQFATFLHKSYMHTQNEKDIEEVAPAPEEEPEPEPVPEPEPTPEPEPEPEEPPVTEPGTIIETKNYNIDFQEVVRRQMRVAPQTDSRWVWYNAGEALTAYYLNPNNFPPNDPGFYQFMKLSEPAGLDPDEVNEHILKGKGILEGTGEYFIEASERYGVNEIYLIAHALLETGNGTSQLANGITVNGKKVYNMFGIGAVDACPLKCGSERAFEEGWDTPGKAIIGGARFVSGNYLSRGQDTLYKMRWNPDGLIVRGVANHQYATDVGWAVKQARAMHSWYEKLSNYTLHFEVPEYYNQPAKTTRPYGEAEFAIDRSIAGDRYVTTAYVLNMRAAPSTEYDVIGQLLEGTIVEAIGQNSGWYKVKANGTEGWVSAAYLKALN